MKKTLKELLQETGLHLETRNGYHIIKYSKDNHIKLMDSKNTAEVSLFLKGYLACLNKGGE
ncbi:hypothetical protein [Cognatishimia sp.]|uniref:hypothetical protein n=1 Tax=Cognatishimia sp. TaxID=2211648 RepID=UPI003515D788|nr:hypothetical protein [Cognatishimia sp.]